MGSAIRTRGCDPILPTLLKPLNGPFPREQVRLFRRKLIPRHSRTRCLGYLGNEGRALVGLVVGLAAPLCLGLFALHVRLHSVLGHPPTRRASRSQAGLGWFATEVGITILRPSNLALGTPE